MANPVEAATPRSAKAITKSDTTLTAFDALYVGGSGDVTVFTVAGETTTFYAAPVGAYIYCQGTKLMSTSTTATSVTALKY